MRIENPYHEGELTVQKRVGAIEGGKRNAANIHDAILQGPQALKDPPAASRSFFLRRLA